MRVQHKTSANIFAWEFALIAGDVTMIKILQDNEFESEGDYLFILANCPVLFKKETCLETLRSFIQKYSREKTELVYFSHFDQKLFFNSSRFNWINTFISHYLRESDIHKVYEDLISTGLQKENLVNSVRKNKLEMDMELLKTKLKSVEKSKDSGFNSFVAAIRQRHFKPAEPVAKKSLYDQYYIDIKKRRIQFNYANRISLSLIHFDVL